MTIYLHSVHTMQKKHMLQLSLVLANHCVNLNIDVLTEITLVEEF